MLRVLTLLLVTLSGAEEASGTQVQLTPPQRIPPTSAEQGRISRCYESAALWGGNEGRILVKATIGVDGRVSGIETVPGIPEWQLRTAECVMAMLRFEPGKRNGVPVVAVVNVPVAFTLGRSVSVELPKVASAPEGVEAAYRLCYPPDELAIVEIHYRVRMTRTGVVRKIELVESTGVPALDQAGACMLEKLRFEPALRDGAGIETTFVVPIRLRPPR